MSPDAKLFLSATDLRYDGSTGSLTSEAATFHSAQGAPHVDVSSADPSSCSRHRPSTDVVTMAVSHTDSGYVSGENPAKERRSTSTSSVRSRRTGATRNSSFPVSGRSTARRLSKSSISSGVHKPGRPALKSRYSSTTQRYGPAQPATYTFFQFPSLASESSSVSQGAPLLPSQSDPQFTAPHSPPPATISYFLLPETRRLEYAAIDAASRGVRGFFVKIIPDCMLPEKVRRRRFHDPEAEESDCGSVRRYRLCLEGDEKDEEKRERRYGKFGVKGSRVRSRDRNGNDDDMTRNRGWWPRFLGWRRM